MSVIWAGECEFMPAYEHNGRGHGTYHVADLVRQAGGGEGAAIDNDLDTLLSDQVEGHLDAGQGGGHPAGLSGVVHLEGIASEGSLCDVGGGEPRRALMMSNGDGGHSPAR